MHWPTHRMLFSSPPVYVSTPSHEFVHTTVPLAAVVSQLEGLVVRYLYEGGRLEAQAEKN